MLRFFRINTVPDQHEEGATWLELFFDLIYVAILIELGNRLSGNLSLHGVIEFAVIFIPIWWSWLAIVSYTRYFPADDIGQRILTVIYMAVIIVMAFEIHSLTKETAAAFTATYGIAKFVLVLMYFRAWVQYPEYRSLTSHYAIIYTFAGLMWLFIATLSPTNFTLWGVAMTISIFTPLIMRGLRQARRKPLAEHPPTKHHYLMHRFGELTIIVLGEFFIKLITDSAGRELVAANFFIGACLLGISVSIWWLYFDHLGHASLIAPGSHIGFWAYNHYPLLAAITAYGVVGTKVFAATPGEVLADEKRYLLCFALAVVVLTLGVIEWASREKEGPMARQPQLWGRAISAAVLVGLAFVGSQLAVEVFTTLVVLVLLTQVGIDIYTRRRTVTPRAVTA